MHDKVNKMLFKPVLLAVLVVAKVRTVRFAVENVKLRVSTNLFVAVPRAFINREAVVVDATFDPVLDKRVAISSPFLDLKPVRAPSDRVVRRQALRQERT